MRAMMCLLCVLGMFGCIEVDVPEQKPAQIDVTFEYNEIECIQLSRLCSAEVTQEAACTHFWNECFVPLSIQCAKEATAYKKGCLDAQEDEAICEDLADEYQETCEDQIFSEPPAQGNTGMAA